MRQGRSGPGHWERCQGRDASTAWSEMYLRRVVDVFVVVLLLVLLDVTLVVVVFEVVVLFVVNQLMTME